MCHMSFGRKQEVLQVRQPIRSSTVKRLIVVLAILLALSLAALFALVAGGAMVFVWKLVLKPLGGMFGIYELLPAFIFSVLVIVIVSLCTAEPDAQITEEFDKVKSGKGLQ